MDLHRTNQIGLCVSILKFKACFFRVLHRIHEFISLTQNASIESYLSLEFYWSKHVKPQFK